MSSGKKKLRGQLESMRKDLHRHFSIDTKELSKELESYANELDEAYINIKRTKVAGSAAAVTGGTLAAVGFGLSFLTFGSSLALCVAGGVIGGAGGIAAGGAQIADYSYAKAARNKTVEKLDKHNQSILVLLEKCQNISDNLCPFGNMDDVFPYWVSFWGNLVVGSGKALKGIGWNIVGTTIKSALQARQALLVAQDVSSVAYSVFRTLGSTAKGLHIAGGVVGALFLPLDIYSLVSSSVELHNETAHNDSDRIKEIVKELNAKCPKDKEIDDMIDVTVRSIN